MIELMILILCSALILIYIAWSFVMAMWLAPAPLIFQLVALTYLIYQKWGLALSSWKNVLIFHTAYSYLIMLIFYAVSSVLHSNKSKLGDWMILVSTLLFVILSLSIYFFSWKKLSI